MTSVDPDGQARAQGVSRAVLLGTFTTLFAFRVATQLIQYVRPTRSLPAFEAWQGSGLGYPTLLASQLVILALMIAGARAVARDARPIRGVGRWLVAIGCAYFIVMAARLVLGLTLLAHIAWFAKPLPALFHIVLASYVITLGDYHSRHVVDRVKVS